MIKEVLLKNYDKYKREELYKGRLYLSQDREDNRRIIKSLENGEYAVKKIEDTYFINILKVGRVEIYLDERKNMKSFNFKYEIIMNKTTVEKVIDIINSEKES